MDQVAQIPRRPTLLVVEDDISLRSALTFDLETDGFVVRAYADARPVLAGPGDVDCMIVDMRLPEVDGLTLIGKLREKGVWAPAILITTNPDHRVRRVADAMGVQIVEKPLIGGELRRRIDELLTASPDS